MAFWSIGHILNKIFDSATSALGVKVTGSISAQTEGSSVTGKTPEIIAGKTAAGNVQIPLVDNWIDDGSSAEKGMLVHARLAGYDNTNFDAIRTIAGAQAGAGTGVLATAPMGWTGGAYERLNVLPATSDALSGGSYNLLVNNFSYDFDGTQWSRRRNNTEGTLLISAARTVAVNSTVQTNYNGRGVVLALQVTANPGGAETLQLQLILSTPVGGGGNYLAAITTVAAVNQTYHLMVYPSATSAPENPTYNKAYSLEVTRDWYARVQPSGAGSWTYSLEQVTNV